MSPEAYRLLAAIRRRGEMHFPHGPRGGPEGFFHPAKEAADSIAACLGELERAGHIEIEITKGEQGAVDGSVARPKAAP